MLARSHVGWGLALSLLLHVTGIATLTLALPRLQVRPGVVPRVELAIVQTPPPVAATTQSPPPAAALPPAPEPAAPPAPKPASVPKLARKPAVVAVPASKLPSSAHADPRSDGSALERVLRQIAATSELTPDQRRRAMLVVLRTWEDPSGQHSAEELIEALLKNVRQARTSAPAASPADNPPRPQP